MTTIQPMGPPLSRILRSSAAAGLGAGHSAFRRFEDSFGTTATVAMRFLYNTAVILIGLSAAFLVVAMLPVTAAAANLLSGALLVAGVIAVGLHLRHLPGLPADPDNVAFMAANGLRRVGGESWADMHGNELKLEDEELDVLVFRVQGRRESRAYIRLDASGRMVSYEAP